MATAAEKAEAKAAFSTATQAKRTVAAFLADYLYDEEDNLREDDILEELGLVPTALSPAQRERFAAGANHIAGRLDVMAGRPKA
jgi:hypothetical protein